MKHGIHNYVGGMSTHANPCGTTTTWVVLVNTWLVSCCGSLAYLFYRPHCAQRKPPAFSLLRGRFWGFSPRRGDTLHWWGWNLACRTGGGETKDRLIWSPPPCQISPLSVQRQGCRTPQNWNFYSDLTKMWNINATQGCIPGVIFIKICRVCTPFQDALAVKIWLDLLKELWSYGGFKLRGSGFPQIFSAP